MSPTSYQTAPPRVEVSQNRNRNPKSMSRQVGGPVRVVRQVDAADGKASRRNRLQCVGTFGNAVVSMLTEDNRKGGT